MTDLQTLDFDTAWGPFRMVWSGRGLLRTRLPDPALALSKEMPLNADHAAEGWAERIRAYFAGAPVSFDDIPLDDSALGPRERAIYGALRAVPRGMTLTYGALAARAGLPGEARSVGVAMARNPWPLVVPCHRVVAAEGKAGGFSAPGGLSTKFRMLRLEGASMPEEAPLLPGLFG